MHEDAQQTARLLSEMLSSRFFSLRETLSCMTCPQGWLRELVWRDKDTAALRESMIQALPDFQELLQKEPVFCFDAAAKLLVWTDLVYTFEDNAEAKETQ